MDPLGNDSRESMKDSHSVGTGCYKLSENVSQQMVFLTVCCWMNRSWGHFIEDLNCFLYPQLPFVTLAAGYFTLSGGLNLTGSAPDRFMLGARGGTDFKWNELVSETAETCAYGRPAGELRVSSHLSQPRVWSSLLRAGQHTVLPANGHSMSCKTQRDTPKSNLKASLRCGLLDGSPLLLSHIKTLKQWMQQIFLITSEQEVEKKCLHEVFSKLLVLKTCSPANKIPRDKVVHS